MRWFWIDRFLEFVSGSHAVAIKAVSRAEFHLDGYLAGHPVMPASLILEGLAQTGGLLVGQKSDFQARIVLAKVSRAEFYRHAQPGDVLTYRTSILGTPAGGAIVKATSHIGDDLQAEADLFLAKLDDRFDGVELFDPEGLLLVLRSMCLFDVAQNADGSPIEVPAHMLSAEREVYDL